MIISYSSARGALSLKTEELNCSLSIFGADMPVSPLLVERYFPGYMMHNLKVMAKKEIFPWNGKEELVVDIVDLNDLRKKHSEKEGKDYVKKLSKMLRDIINEIPKESRNYNIANLESFVKQELNV